MMSKYIVQTDTTIPVNITDYLHVHKIQIHTVYIRIYY